METTTVTIPVPTHRRLRVRAALDQADIGETATKLIEAGLDETKTPEPKASKPAVNKITK